MPLVDVNLFGVPAFSVCVDADGTLRYDGFNAAGAAMTGIHPTDWIGREPRERLPADMAERVSACYRRCLSSGESVEYEDEFDQPAGRLWWRTTIVPVLDADGIVAGLVGFGVNITAQKQREAKLRDDAFLDPLTGAANRRGFERAMESALFGAQTGGSAFMVIIADVDSFKAINDRHGHAVGDRVLANIAMRLRSGLGDTDCVARIGGDEFAAIAATGGRSLAEFAVHLERLLAPPLTVGDVRLGVGVSLGLAEWRPGVTGAELLSEADARMYDRKSPRAA